MKNVYVLAGLFSSIVSLSLFAAVPPVRPFNVELTGGLCILPVSMNPENGQWSVLVIKDSVIFRDSEPNKWHSFGFITPVNTARLKEEAMRGYYVNGFSPWVAGKYGPHEAYEFSPVLLPKDIVPGEVVPVGYIFMRVPRFIRENDLADAAALATGKDFAWLPIEKINVAHNRLLC